MFYDIYCNRKTKIFEQRKIFGTPCICTREKHTWAFNRVGRSGLRLFLEGIASVGSWKAIRGPVNPLLPRFYGGDVVNALRRRPAIGNPLNGGRGKGGRANCSTRVENGEGSGSIFRFSVGNFGEFEWEWKRKKERGGGKKRNEEERERITHRFVSFQSVRTIVLVFSKFLRLTGEKRTGEFINRDII